MDSEHELIMSALADIKVDLNKISDCVFGNGKPGMLTRIDRLEITQANRIRLNWIIVGALVVLLVGSGYNFMLNKSAIAGINKVENTGRCNVSDSTKSKR